MKETKIRGKCDYCHKRRMIGKMTKFCAECLSEWQRVTDMYFDGDPLYPLKVVKELCKKSTSE